jgi:hypothetical protein
MGRDVVDVSGGNTRLLKRLDHCARSDSSGFIDFAQVCAFTRFTNTEYARIDGRSSADGVLFIFNDYDCGTFRYHQTAPKAIEGPTCFFRRTEPFR